MKPDINKIGRFASTFVKITMSIAYLVTVGAVTNRLIHTPITNITAFVIVCIIAAMLLICLAFSVLMLWTVD